ncbi:Protein of unknown function [Gryllus bimaculatus]|nr:Protein of unknown function [Gryllus bimaculatus]
MFTVDTSFDMLLRYSWKKRHGLEYLVIDDFRQRMHVEKMKVNFSNLFNDPAQLLPHITYRFTLLSGKLLGSGDTILPAITATFEADVITREGSAVMLATD